MGLSHIKGNSGFLGVDKRSQIPNFVPSSLTGTSVNEAGTMSVKKHFLERNGGILKPFCTNGITQGVLYKQNWDDNFISGDWFTSVSGDYKWAIADGPGYDAFGTSVTGSSAAVVFNTSTLAYTYPKGTTLNLHFYGNLYIPEGVTNLSIDFDWKCGGESSFDFGYFWITNSGDTPSGFRGSAGDRDKRLGGDDSVSSTSSHYRRYNDTYNSSALNEWVTEPTIFLTSGATQLGGSSATFVPGELNRLVWSWTNDDSLGDDPPFGVDNIVIKFTGDTSYCIDPYTLTTLNDDYQDNR